MHQYANFKIGREILVYVSVCAPQAQEKEESERFWTKVGDCVESFKMGKQVIVMGDKNTKVED